MDDISRRIGVISLSLLLPLLSGCAILMSSHLPLERSPAGLCAGVRRCDVDRGYGFPVAAAVTDEKGEVVEKIHFVDGVPKANRDTRMIVHGTLDYCTFCLWELVGTPFELCAMAIGHPKYVYYIVYDADGKIVKAVDGATEEGKMYQSLSWGKTMPSTLPMNESAVVRNWVVDRILAGDDKVDVLSVGDVAESRPAGCLYKMKQYTTHAKGSDAYCSFSLELEDVADDVTIRKVRHELRRYIRDDYCENMRGESLIDDDQYIVVDIRWNVDGCTIKGVASVLRPKKVEVKHNYNAITGDVDVEVKIDALQASQLPDARSFARGVALRVAEDLAREKNIVLTTGKRPVDGKYKSENETWDGSENRLVVRYSLK